MDKDRIEKGYVLKPRKTLESDIMQKPPYVREIWDHLCLIANHSVQNYNGNVVKRGQVFRQYKDIREALCWYAGFRKVMYNENQVKKAMKYLRDTGRITTAKALGGVLITICKYDRYQNPANYERTTGSTTDSTSPEPKLNHPLPHNNKNGNNGKTVQEYKDRPV